MKFRLLYIFLLFTSNIWAQQELSVISFKKLESDMDARVHHPEKDQNGKNAALIKVVTTERGFKFDVGSLGVIKTQQKKGEIWVYVPEKARKITVSHDQLGVLRDYLFPESIVSGNVYELRLHSGRVETVVKDNVIQTEWIGLTTAPEGANVFLNDQLVGKTPLTKQFPLGNYNYRIELPKYYAEAGRFELKDEKVIMNIPLRPNYGSIQVSSKPEEGMEIFLNEESTDKRTPALLEKVKSGEYSLSIISDWYSPETKKIIVEDGKTTEVDFKLEKMFAEVSITTTQDASIFINDEYKGKTSFQGRLLSGVYDLKIVADKYYEHTQQLLIETGKNQSFDIPLQVITGQLSITSLPFDADIYLNGKKYGKTPLNIKDLMIGNYNLELRLKDYESIKKKIAIKENEITSLEEQLKEYKGEKVQVAKYPKGTVHCSGTPTAIVDVTNPITGMTWMDRNLGASRAAKRSYDKKSYGDLYQWGRGADGHQCRNSATTTILSSSDQPGHGYFILAPNSPRDWRSPQKTNLWQGVNGVNNPCPNGYRLPTETELNAERTSWSSNNAAGAFASPLKLPMAGLRDGNYGRLYDAGSFGSYWSSTVSSTNSAYLYFNSSFANMKNPNRDFGLSVRCIKEKSDNEDQELGDVIEEFKKPKKTNNRKNILFGSILPHEPFDIQNGTSYTLKNFNYGLRYVNLAKHGFFIDYSHTFNFKEHMFALNENNEAVNLANGKTITGGISAESNIRSFNFNTGYVFRLDEHNFASLGLGYYFYELRQPIAFLDFERGMVNDLILIPEHSVQNVVLSAGYYLGIERLFIGYSLFWSEQTSFFSKFMLGFSLEKKK